MKIAIVGTGIAGMTAANLLAGDHEITVFEAGSHVGGHTNTVEVDVDGRRWALDTGFMVFNERTYPNFVRLLAHLGVASQPSDMSFSVKCDRTGLEYCGSSLSTLFAQKRNLLRPSFYRMLADVVRFNRNAPELLAAADPGPTLGQYVEENGYSRQFCLHYLFPMGAAIWSARPDEMRHFPARYFVQFFQNHGLLSLADRPQWRVIQGGSYCYAEALTRLFRDRIRLRCPVRSIERGRDFVTLTTGQGNVERYDHVVIAAHSDQALALLADPNECEREVLGSFRYQANEAVLHTDAGVLPRRHRAWASWNYHVPVGRQSRVAVTYLLNRLQSLDARRQFCVSLNYDAAIDPALVLRRIAYQHPVYSLAAVAAQRRHREISGVARTHFCGAYWGYGFHEDGVNSALSVGKYFGKSLTSCKVASTKDMSAIAASSPCDTSSAIGCS